MFSIYDYSEVIRELLKSGDTLDSIDDFLYELADDAVPIYNGDIIAEWQEHPEYWDRYAEESGEVSGSIISQMSRDLFLLYRDELREYAEEIYNEIEDERRAA